jgi:hypothetical protein
VGVASPEAERALASVAGGLGCRPRRCRVTQVDIDVSAGAGTFDATIVDPQGAVGGPVNVIQVTDTWRVDCSWSVTGMIRQMSGTWRVQVVLEGLGGAAPEQQQPTQIVPMVPGQATPYTTQVVFPGGTINLGTEDAFSFHIIALLTARDGANNPLPVAAAVDLGMVQVYRGA